MTPASGRGVIAVATSQRPGAVTHAEVPETGGGSAGHPSRDGAKGPIWKAWVSRYAILGILALTVLVFSILEPETFFTPDNFLTIFQQQAVLACLALGLLLPLAVGEFDLSVGFILGLSAVTATQLGNTGALPDVAVVLIVLAIGAAIGTLTGVLVARFHVHSLIASLGVGFAVSGLTIGVSGSQTLYKGVPELIMWTAETRVLGLEVGVWIVLGIAILLYLMLSRSVLGRRIYAIGGSERVARFSGLPTRTIKGGAFTFAGLLAATAGMIQLGQSGAANPGFGTNLLLPAFAAIFLGATAIRPGFFNVWGTVIAILVLAVGFTGLALWGVPLWVEPLFDGAVLLVAVLFAGAEARSLGQGR